MPILRRENFWRRPSSGDRISRTARPCSERWQHNIPPILRLAQTASAVYRSLAYFEPADTEVAAKIEDNLLQANPGNSEIMSRIGDIYADRDLFAKAAPYWDRIPRIAPGQSSGYLEAASIYWDYFDFDNALRLLNEGRKKLGDENLYSYEAGAIYENQRDYAARHRRIREGRSRRRRKFARRLATDGVGPQAKAARPG